VVVHYYAQSNNGITTFKDHSGNGRDLPIPPNHFFDGVTYNNGVVNMTRMFEEDYSKGWTVEVSFFVNNIDNTVIVSTPLGDVKLINQRLCFSRGVVLHLRADAIIIGVGKWYHVAIMQNGKFFVDRIETNITVLVPMPPVSQITWRVIIYGSFDGSISFLKITKANILSHDMFIEIPFTNYTITRSSPAHEMFSLFYSTPSSKYIANDVNFSIYNTYVTHVTTDTINEGEIAGEWIQIELPNYVYLKKCVLIPDPSFPSSFPNEWYILGSLNGNTWQNMKRDLFDVENEGYYFKYFRIIITQTKGNTWAGFKDIRLYETRIILPTKTTQELGSTSALTDNVVSYDLPTYFKNIINLGYVSENESANITLLDGVLVIQGSYRNDTYLVSVTGYNDFGGKTLRLTTVETLRHPIVVNGGLEILGVDKTLYNASTLVVNLRPYFKYAFLFECSVPQSGVVIDENDSLIVTRMYRNAELKVHVFGISNDHRGIPYKAESVLLVSDTVRPPNIIKSLQDEGVIRLTDNTVQLNLLNNFQNVELFETDWGTLVDNNKLVLTGDFRNTKYDVKVTGNAMDYLGVNFTVSSYLTVSETIRYPDVNPNIPLPNVEFVSSMEGGDVTTESINLNDKFLNTQSYSVQSFSYDNPVTLEMFVDNAYFPKGFDWNETKPYTFIREGGKKQTELTEMTEGITEAFSVDYSGGWTIEIKIKITKFKTTNAIINSTILRTPLGNLILTHDCTHLEFESHTYYTELQQNVWYEVVIQQNGMYSVNGVQNYIDINHTKGNKNGRYFVGHVLPEKSVDCLVDYIRIYNKLEFYTTIALNVHTNGQTDTKEFSWTGNAPFELDPITRKYYTNITGARGIVEISNWVVSKGWTIDIMFKIIARVAGSIELFKAPFGILYLSDDCTKFYFTESGTTRFDYDGLHVDTWYRVILQHNGAYSVNGSKYVDDGITPPMQFIGNQCILGSPCIVSHVRIYNALQMYPVVDLELRIEECVGNASASALSFSVNKWELDFSFVASATETGLVVIVQTMFGEIRVISKSPLSLIYGMSYTMQFRKDGDLYKYTSDVTSGREGYARIHNISVVFAQIESNINVISWDYNPYCSAESVVMDNYRLEVVFLISSTTSSLLIHTQCGTLQIKQNESDATKIIWVPGKWYTIVITQNGSYTTNDLTYVDNPIKKLGSDSFDCVISYKDSKESTPIPMKRTRVKIVNNLEWNDVDANIYIDVYRNINMGYVINDNLASATFTFNSNAQTGPSISITTSFGRIRLVKNSGDFGLDANTVYTLVLNQTNMFSTIYEYHFVGKEKNRGSAKVINDMTPELNNEVIINDSLNTRLKEKHPHIPQIAEYTDGWTIDMFFKITGAVTNNRVLISTPVGQLRFVDNFARFSFSEYRITKFENDQMNVGQWYRVILRQDGSHHMETLVDVAPTLESLPEFDGVKGQCRIYNRLELFKHIDLDVIIDLCVDTNQDTVESHVDSFFVDQTNGWRLEFEFVTSTTDNKVSIRAPFGVVQISGAISFVENTSYSIAIEQVGDMVIGSSACKYYIRRITDDLNEAFVVTGGAILNNNTEIQTPLEIHFYDDNIIYKTPVTWNARPSFGRTDDRYYHMTDDRIEGVAKSNISYAQWSIDILFQTISTPECTLAQMPIGNIVLEDSEMSFRINGEPVFTHKDIHEDSWYRLIVQSNGVYSVNGVEYLFPQTSTNQNDIVTDFIVGCVGNASQCRVSHFRVHNNFLGEIKTIQALGARINRNMLVIVADYRNIIYTITVIGTSVDHEGIVYEVSSSLTVTETLRYVAVKKQIDAVVLKNVPMVYDLDDYFAYAEDYMLEQYSQDIAAYGNIAARINIEKNILTLIPAYRYASYRVRILASNRDCSDIVTSRQIAFWVIEEVEPPYIIKNLDEHPLPPILTDTIQRIYLYTYFYKATLSDVEYDFTVSDSFTNEVIQSHGVSIEYDVGNKKHYLVISPDFRNVTYDVLVVPKSTGYYPLPGPPKKLVRYISHSPNHADDTIEEIKQMSTLFGIREGPPLPVPVEPRVSLTRMHEEESLVISLSNYFTGTFNPGSFHSLGINIGIHENQLSVVNQYRNSIHAYNIHVANESGNSKKGYIVCVQEGSPIPTVKQGATSEYILLSDNQIDISLPEYFTGIATFYKYGSVTTTNKLLSITGSNKDTTYEYKVFAGNESGISTTPFTFKILEGKNVSDCFVCTIYRSAYFETDANVFKSNPDNVAYSSNFRSIGSSTNQNIPDYGDDTNYSVEWGGYFKSTEEGSYTFYLGSDDASIAVISSDTIAIPGIHDTIEKSCTIKLSKNTNYNISIKYGNNSIDSVCYFEFESPSVRRTSNFENHIHWLPLKYFTIMDANNVANYSMRYSEVKDARFQSVESDSKSKNCIFKIISFPSTDHLAIQEVTSGLYLKCSDDEDNLFTISVLDPADERFHWYILFNDIAKATYSLYSIYHLQFVTSTSKMDYRQSKAGSFYFRSVNENNFKINNGFERFDTLQLTDDDFPFKINLSKYIGNINGLIISPAGMFDTHDTNVAIFNPREVTNEYSVSIISNTTTITTLKLIQNLEPVLKTGERVTMAIRNAPGSLNLSDYVSNASVYTIIFNECGTGHNINNDGKLTVNVDSGLVIDTTYIILIQCSANLQLSNKLLLLTIYVTQSI
jgi:hypothetical protein